jgi:tRNA-splicing ligase RtcB
VERLGPKLYSWASLLEDATRRQAEATAAMPFVRPHLALMPDAHLGKGATVGSVIPTDGAIMPAAVGVDIGCGMQAVRTPFTAADLDPATLPALHASIARRVPLSAGHYNRTIQETAAPRLEQLAKLAASAGFDPGRYAGNWQLQLGSLGSGNHFIEVSLDERGRIWLFLHTGSRGVGNKIATAHIAVAQREIQRRSLTLPDRDLAWLEEAPTSSTPTSARCSGRRSSRGSTARRSWTGAWRRWRATSTRRYSGSRRSTATTTTRPGRRTSGVRCGCRGRGRSTPRTAFVG